MYITSHFISSSFYIEDLGIWCLHSPPTTPQSPSAWRCGSISLPVNSPIHNLFWMHTVGTQLFAKLDWSPGGFWVLVFPRALGKSRPDERILGIFWPSCFMYPWEVNEVKQWERTNEKENIYKTHIQIQSHIYSKWPLRTTGTKMLGSMLKTLCMWLC